jgi:hypothetical protein
MLGISMARIVAPGFGGRGAGVSATAHRNPARVVVPSHVPHNVPWRPLLPLPVPTNSLPSFSLMLFVVGIVFSLSFVVFLLSITTHATEFFFACCDDVRKGKKLLVAASSTISQQEANYPLPL